MLIDRNIALFLQEGSLYFQIPGEGALRLKYREKGVFQSDFPGDPLIAEFDLAKSPAPFVKLTWGPRKFVADRVEQ